MTKIDSEFFEPNHTLLRKKALALARPNDNAGCFVAGVDENFDLTQTIFQTLPPGYKTFFQRTKLDTRLEWHVAAAAAIEKAYASRGPAPSLSDDAPLHAFMINECDFSMEHADGSFLEMNANNATMISTTVELPDASASAVSTFDLKPLSLLTYRLNES